MRYRGSLEALGGLDLGAEEGEELRRYLNALPGTELNLSPDEIALVRGLSPTGQPEKDAEALAAMLRKVVLGRYRAYRESGLEGIVPYTRRHGSQVRPGEELRSSLEESQTFRSLFPDLYHTRVDYPVTPPQGVTERFSWGKLLIDGRPASGLSHRLSMGGYQAGITGRARVLMSPTPSIPATRCWCCSRWSKAGSCST